MMNQRIDISPTIYRLIESLLKTGKIEKDGKLVDFGSVQTITIENGLMKLNPPLKISGKFGPVRINTTVTEISSNSNGSIVVDINNSPINLEIRPNES